MRSWKICENKELILRGITLNPSLWAAVFGAMVVVISLSEVHGGYTLLVSNLRTTAADSSLKKSMVAEGFGTRRIWAFFCIQRLVGGIACCIFKPIFISDGGALFYSDWLDAKHIATRSIVVETNRSK